MSQRRGIHCGSLNKGARVPTNAALLGFVEKNLTAEAQRSRRIFLRLLLLEVGLLINDNVPFLENGTKAIGLGLGGVVKNMTQLDKNAEESLAPLRCLRLCGEILRCGPAAL